MSVEQLDVIDDVQVDGESGPVVLSIVDPLDWADAPAHQAALEKKFGVYLSYVESGEIMKTYAEARVRGVGIHIVFRFPPRENAVLFLEQARKALESAGFGLSHEVLPDSGIP